MIHLNKVHIIVINNVYHPVCVLVSVFVKSVTPGKCLTTHITPEWLLTCMNTFVSV